MANQPRRGLKTEWIKGLNPEEVKRFKELFSNSTLVLDKLRSICYNNIRKIENSSRAQYESPSWAYLQADNNGYARAYREMIELLSLTEEDRDPKTNG